MSTDNEDPVEEEEEAKPKPWTDTCHVVLIKRNMTQLAQIRVNRVNTWQKLSQWVIDSGYVPTGVEGLRLQMEWSSKNGQGTEWVTKDTEWKLMMTRMRTQAVQKIRVVVSTHRHLVERMLT
jgi:hypothetical protein